MSVLFFGFVNLWRDAAALPAPAWVLKGSGLELVVTYLIR